MSQLRKVFAVLALVPAIAGIVIAALIPSLVVVSIAGLSATIALLAVPGARILRDIRSRLDATNTLLAGLGQQSVGGV